MRTFEQFWCWLWGGHEYIRQYYPPGVLRHEGLWRCECLKCGKITGGVTFTLALALALSACSPPIAPTPLVALQPHAVTAYEIESWYWATFDRPPSPGEIAQHVGEPIALFMQYLSTASCRACTFTLPSLTNETIQ